MTDRISPSRLATYWACPRQYEFNYEHQLETKPSKDLERYYNRGRVLDTALQLTADDVSRTTEDETVQSLAIEYFTEQWNDNTAEETYPSSAAYEYDRRVSKAAIEDYLNPSTSGEGLDHLRRSIGTEVHLEWSDDTLGSLHGYADNIVETDDGLLIIDYKASYSSGRFPNKSGSDLEKQLAGDDHYPDRLKKWLQIAMYWTGVQEHDLYSSDDEIEFLFYGLIDSKERTPTPEGYTVEVSGKAWEITDLYNDHRESFDTLVHDGITNLRNGAFNPTDSTWELIQEEACEDCDYRTGCGDYLAEEVQFS